MGSAAGQARDALGGAAGAVGDAAGGWSDRIQDQAGDIRSGVQYGAQRAQSRYSAPCFTKSAGGGRRGAGYRRSNRYDAA